MPLRIPSLHAEAFTAFSKMDDADFVSFLTAVRESKPSISIEQLSVRVAAKAMLDEGLVRKVFQMLVGLRAAMTNAGMEVSEFASELCSNSRESLRNDLTKVDDWNSVESRLVETIADNDTLTLSAKAYDLITNVERLYCRSRILTDIRPVFVDTTPMDAQGSVILHALRVTYHEGPEGTLNQFFVQLDSEDLKHLRDVIDRAIEKDAIVRKKLDAAGMPALDNEILTLDNDLSEVLS